VGLDLLPEVQGDVPPVAPVEAPGGQAPAQDRLQQAVICTPSPGATAADEPLEPPPEYLPAGLARRQEPELPVAVAKPSLTAAAGDAPPRGPYDVLAETILAQIPAGRPAALGFTSVEEDVGRIEMVASLAVALARREPQGVLAVGADFRRGVSTAPGLGGVLGGRAAWEDAIAATEIPSLFVLPAGHTDSAIGLDDPPADVSLPADRLAPLLEQWSGRFRLVLVDAPLLVLPGAVGLARHFYGIYLAVRLGRTRRRALHRAVQALEAAGGRLLGAILLGPTVSG
jgi:Mrp family chromosome partitioning ATPase